MVFLTKVISPVIIQFLSPTIATHLTRERKKESSKQKPSQYISASGRQKPGYEYLDLFILHEVQITITYPECKTFVLRAMSLFTNKLRDKEEIPHNFFRNIFTVQKIL